MMNSNDSPYVVCHNGVFVLPEPVLKSLAAGVKNGFVYLRQDEDVLTISTTRVADGWRRVLNSRFRAPMFRDATTLAIVDLKESIRVMGIEWRVSPSRRVPPGSPPAER